MRFKIVYFKVLYFKVYYSLDNLYQLEVAFFNIFYFLRGLDVGNLSREKAFYAHHRYLYIALRMKFNK